MMTDDTALDFMAFAEEFSLTVGNDDPWQTLAKSVSKGNVIPIISNSLRDDRFIAMFRQPNPELNVMVSQMLATAIKYPLPDNEDLARVAQYHQVIATSRQKAKEDYLRMLRSYIIRWAKQNDVKARAIIEDENLEAATDILFGDLLTKFGYPKYPDGTEDPLRQLAKLPLPIYVTTSYYESLEDALLAAGKTPRTQVCTWTGNAAIPEKYWPINSIVDEPERAVKEPLVFHLFGIERFPQTMVLSVDDYLNFMVRIFLRETQVKTSQDEGEPSPIPIELWAKISGLPLLLLGYKLPDWDFQVVFRGLITAKPTTPDRDAGMVIQVRPDSTPGIKDSAAEALRKYMQEYFSRDVKFRIEFDKPDSFIAKLYETYQQYSARRA